MAIHAPNRQQERREASTKAMLDAAVDLIAEGGLAAMTFAAIGERSDFSRTLVTYRFGSRDGLIEALVDHIVSGWTEREILQGEEAVPDHQLVPEAKGRPGLDGVIILIEAIHSQFKRDQRWLRALYTLMFAATGPDEELRMRFSSFHRDFRRDLSKIISDGQADGSIRGDIAPDDEATVILGGLRGIGYQWLLDPENLDPSPALRCLAESASERLRPR